MHLPPNKKVYFLSDFHLGVPDAATSLQREKTIVQFLDLIKQDAHTVFLVGDMFDFWFEYKKVVPRGYVRLLGKLAELSDAGIDLHFFVGNHDMWMKNYFQQEMHIPVYFKPTVFSFNKFSFYIGHGDGLGPGDAGYKFIKKIFRSPVCQWLFGILPPAIGIGAAHYFSGKSRGSEQHEEEIFLGEDKEWLLIYSREMLKHKVYHYFVFGHRHLPIDYRLSKESRYINLGEWMNYCTYAVFDGQTMELKSFTGRDDKIVRRD